MCFDGSSGLQETEKMELVQAKGRELTEAQEQLKKQVHKSEQPQSLGQQVTFYTIKIVVCV